MNNPAPGPFDGILNVHKHAGISSARVVGRVKRLLPRGVKIGHAGTLDPFATGVLLLLLGKATRLCEKLMDQPKQYEATIKFGAVTATDDPESPEQPYSPPAEAPPLHTPSESDLLRALPCFVGRIMQQPPAYSALKVGGRRAYDLARQGRTVTLAPRPVQVYGIELLWFDWPACRLRIDCGRGTYIRSIARDLGASLRVGGYLTALCRTQVGRFTLQNACDPETLNPNDLPARLSTNF